MKEILSKARMLLSIQSLNLTPIQNPTIQTTIELPIIEKLNDQ
jgi:hypothetical protein